MHDFKIKCHLFSHVIFSQNAGKEAVEQGGRKTAEYGAS
jgi:hypothetical protein